MLVLLVAVLGILLEGGGGGVVVVRVGRVSFWLPVDGELTLFGGFLFGGDLQAVVLWVVAGLGGSIALLLCFGFMRLPFAFFPEAQRPIFIDFR